MEYHERERREGLSVPNLKQFREIVEILARLGFVLLGGCYVVGLLILNLHLAQYGVFNLNILQVQYIMAGALWIFLILFVYCFLFLPVYSARDAYQEWKQGLRLRPILQVLFPLFSLTALVYVLEFFSRFRLGVMNASSLWPLFVVLGILSLTALGFRYLYKEFAVLFPGTVIEQRSNNVDLTSRWRSLFMVLYWFVLLIVNISLYAVLVYPKFSSALGGGHAQKVEFVVNAKHIGTLNTMGLQVSPKRHRLGPLEVIFETSEFFVVVPPTTFKPEGTVRAIRLKKDLIDAAFYLKSKRKE